MGKWAYENKKEKLNPSLFLAGLGILGFAIILLAFAMNVNSAPTPPFTSSAQFGHQPGDIGPGDFQGSPTDKWSFPGMLGIGVSPTNQLTVLSPTPGQPAMVVTSNNGVVTKFTNTGGSNTVQIGLSDNTPIEWRIGTKMGSTAPSGAISIRNQTANLINAITITKEGAVGINQDNPSKALDVSGEVHASQDICTDTGGGQCLSQVNQTLYLPTTPSTPYCNPNCTGGSLTAANKILTVTCGTGLDTTNVPIHCGGKITLPSGNSLRSYRSEALYLSMGDTVNGCILEWDTSNGSVPAGTVGFVKAVCVKVNG